MATGFNSAVIARVAAALYDVQLGNASMSWALDQVDRVHGGNVGALVQSVINSDPALKALTPAQMAAVIVKNVGVTSGVADAEAYVAAQLTAAGAANYGTAITSLLNGFAALPASNPYGAAASAYNAQIMGASAYAQSIGTVDALVHPPAGASQTLVITKLSALGADVMKLTGGQDVRIDFTNPANQITGLDLDGDGVIEFDGKERSVTGKAAGYEVVDAYSRNPLNHQDAANNMLGDIYFDGTSNDGADGDGVGSDGNVFLGGLGADKAFGGVGNDFLAGGGIAQGRTGVQDELHGGRNADFFFAEFSGLDATDGSTLWIDGGNTADDVSAGNEQSPEDSDWLLFEASDDDEPVHIWLNDDNIGDQRDGSDGLNDGMGRVLSRSGESLQIDDVENVDASGNLYGFLNGMDTKIGGRAVDSQAAVGTGTDNYGFGASAQLWISGSDVSNIIIGGYDNDYIEGRAGVDILMGGRLDHLRNPNMINITNNGRDELVGGDDDDHLVFETDGGIYEGGNTYNVDDAGADTLWLTSYTFGTKTAADIAADGRVRIDLMAGKVGGLANAAGYGGADKAAATGRYTADQTNYKPGIARAQVQDMESIIATGLGDIDYLAAGANDPELSFNNQQNLFGLGRVDLDIRGTQGDNVLYATSGNDKLEGREGDDYLSGGDGQDDFFFASWDHTDGNLVDIQEGVDVIHRQTDANNDNLWDGTFERDFGIGQTGTSSSTLKIQIVKAGGNAPTDQLTDVVNSVTQIVTGVKVNGTFQGITLNTADIQNATTYAGLTTAINAALDATAYGADLDAALQADGFTILITSKAGNELADQTTEVKNAGVSVSQKANTATANVFTTDLQTSSTPDRIIYVSYEDRADAERTDDDSFLGSSISLGSDSYAEDRVVNFADEDGDGIATTRIAEDQSYVVNFTNLTTQDVVQLNVNGVIYKLQVGVDLDGNIQADEDGIGENQATIQDNFLTRLTDFINSFMDDDTVAGKVVATKLSGTQIQLIQGAYNGEETVFMVRPTVSIEQKSGGEPARASVINNSDHELELLDYDGRNNGLNRENVLFWGTEEINRSFLETSKNAGGALAGTEAIVIDGGANDLAANVSNDNKAAIPNNTATNGPLAGLNFAAHGDDLLLGGSGVDQISGGTGDDRVMGSVGSATAPAIGSTTGETADGGKNFYRVQVLGEATARVYVLNKWEAANPSQVADLSSLTISSITPIQQNESGDTLVSGIFDDTLQFQQRDFTVGKTNFTVTLDDFEVSGGVVQLKRDGAGLVMVDMDGDAATTNDRSFTRFSNFENIRTVSGTGNAVANDGQGTDTLDVSALSKATGGVRYNLTNDNLATNVGGDQGSVYYSADKHTTPIPTFGPLNAEYEALVIKVDGVENVTAGEGSDLLLIDEAEAAKNNIFQAGLGTDRIEYRNDFAGTTVGEATVTVFVNASVDMKTNAVTGAADTDVVRMTNGRVGSVIANDLLGSVETITLAGETAQSTREDDTIDVSKMTSGATVSYVNGKIWDSSAVLQLQIENIVQMENVLADGNDTVIVADADVMNNNTRSDELNATPAVDIQLATFLDFDEFASGKRVAFTKQSSAQITDVINQNQFNFNLGTVGTDRVDYSNETGRIVAVMNFTANDTSKFVLVDGDSDLSFTDAESRVDRLISVEQIVASQGDSVIDATNAGRDINIIFSYNQPDQKAAFIEGVHKQTTGLANDRQINTVRVADAQNQSALGNVDLLEYRDLGNAAPTVALPDELTATWNSVEGSDYREYVEFTQWENQVTHTLNLRGGANEVNYNERTDGIQLNILGVDSTIGGVANQYHLSVGHMNAVGTVLGTYDTIYGYNQAKAIGGGSGSNAGSTANSLRIEASQGDQDFINVALAAGTTSLFLIGNVESSGSSVVTATFVDPVTNLATGTGLTMSGFEYLWDAIGNDTYTITDLSNFVSKMTLIDFNQTYDGAGAFTGSTDRDGVKLTNGAFESATIRPPISHAITVNNDLRMGDGSANDLQWLGVNNNTYRAALGNPQNSAAGGVSVGFDFQVLDISEVTNQTKITATGSALGTNDELVVGGLGYLSTTGTAIVNFDTLSLTNASAGTTFDFDLDAAQLQDGTNTKIVGFDADMGAFDLSRINDGRAITVTVTDLAGVGSTVVGSAGVDTITGGNGTDTITGGAGADVLDGGFVAAVGSTYTVTLSGVTATSGAAGNTMTIGGMVITTSAAPTLATEIAAGADADQIGAKFAAQTLASWRAALDADGFATADANALESVTYDAANNQLVFKFSTAATSLTGAASPVDLTTAPAVTGAAVLGATETDTDFVPQADSVDNFVYTAASQSTASVMDSIKNFNIDSGALVINDRINLTAIDANPATVGVNEAFAGLASNNTAQASYAAVATLAGAAFAGADLFIGRTATDAYLFVDADQSGTLTAADMVIKLVGVTDVSGFDLLGNVDL